jgi:hypothetical protein
MSKATASDQAFTAHLFSFRINITVGMVIPRSIKPTTRAVRIRGTGFSPTLAGMMDSACGPHVFCTGSYTPLPHRNVSCAEVDGIRVVERLSGGM